MATETPGGSGNCGDCVNFDRARVNGAPVDANDPSKGHCRSRAGSGLLLGPVRADGQCRLKPTQFQPRPSGQ